MKGTTKVIEELETKCALQEQQIVELSAKLTWFEEQFRLSQKRRFAGSSEATEQPQLFNDSRGRSQTPT